jgi:hypothetical protein
MEKHIKALDKIYSELIKTHGKDKRIFDSLQLIDDLQNKLNDLNQDDLICDDCGDECNLRPWKLEPEIRLCENCHENRLIEEEE